MELGLTKNTHSRQASLGHVPRPKLTTQVSPPNFYILLLFCRFSRYANPAFIPNHGTHKNRRQVLRLAVILLLRTIRILLRRTASV